MKNFIPLTELMKLPHTKQIHMVAMLFIQKCLDETEVRKKKFMATLVPIKKFLSKQEISKVYILYDYLYSLKSKTIMDLTTCFNNAYEYQQKLRLDNDRKLQPEVEEYSSYEECLDKLLEEQ